MITYRTRGLLPGFEPDEEFVFIIDDRTTPPTLFIPGDHRGPDVCIAHSLEQVAWLDSRDDLVALWDCQWRFVSTEAADAFVELISTRATP